MTIVLYTLLQAWHRDPQHREGLRRQLAKSPVRVLESCTLSGLIGDVLRQSDDQLPLLPELKLAVSDVATFFRTHPSTEARRSGHVHKLYTIKQRPGTEVLVLFHIMLSTKDHVWTVHYDAVADFDSPESMELLYPRLRDRFRRVTTEEMPVEGDDDDDAHTSLLRRRVVPSASSDEKLEGLKPVKRDIPPQR